MPHYARMPCASSTERRTSLAIAVALKDGSPVFAPIVVARETVRAIGANIAIVDEAIATSVHVRGLLDSPSHRQYSFLRGGGLGWGMPAAVGCSLGLWREPVVCLVGDGAAMYSPQALWTTAHEKLPVTFVVMNNREYNVLKNFMKSQTDYISARNNRFIAMEIDQPAIDYPSLAHSMGVPAHRVEKTSDRGGDSLRSDQSRGDNHRRGVIRATFMIRRGRRKGRFDQSSVRLGKNRSDAGNLAT